MAPLIEHLEALPTSSIVRSGGSVFEGPPELPVDAQQFFESVSGGEFMEPPNRITLLKRPFRFNVNQIAWAPWSPQTYPEYDRCYLFGCATDPQGRETYRGISLNPETHGFVFAYVSEAPGVSPMAFLLFRSFSDWLANLIGAQNRSAGIGLIDSVEGCPPFVRSSPRDQTSRELNLPDDERFPIVA